MSLILYKSIIDSTLPKKVLYLSHACFSSCIESCSSPMHRVCTVSSDRIRLKTTSVLVTAAEKPAEMLAC